MRTSITLIVSVLALFTITQAAPSFRALQNTTVVDPTVVVPAPTNVTVIDNTTTVANTTVPKPTTPVNARPGYTPLDVTVVQNDSVVNGAFVHGMNAVVQTAIAQGKVPVSVYNVTNWQGAWYRNRSNGVSYAFEAQLVGANGVNFDCNVTVLHKKDGTNTMTAYHYSANNIKRNSFPANGYRFLTPAQVHNNTVVQGAIVFGAKTVVEFLINQNKIPAQDLNYTITNLYLAAYKRSRAGTSYRYQIAAVNGAGVNVRTNYTVFYRNSNKTYTQTAYWYRAFNYSASDLVQPANNTNVTVVNNSTAPATGSNVTVVDNSTASTGTTVVDNTTAASNVTVVDNTTSTDNSTGPVTAANATTGSNSTEGAPVNVTTNAVQVNIDPSKIFADYTTPTTTALIIENFPVPNNNSTSVVNTPAPAPVDTTLPATNTTVVDNSTTVAANGTA